MSAPCRYLRWKGHREARRLPLEDLARRLARVKVPFTCLLTTHPWGPDDGPVAPELCGPGRPCSRVPDTRKTDG